MPLSRHFYAIDEVCAALSRATTRNDVRETLFWTLELLDSGCGAEAISTLFEAWLWQKGPFCLAWRTSMEALSADEVSEEAILLAAYQLSTVSWERRDASLWTVLASHAPPVRVGPWCPLVSSLWEGFTLLEQYFLRAVHQGRGAAAWWAAEQLEWSRVQELLSATELDYHALLGYTSTGYDRAMRALLVLTACLSPSQRASSLTPLPTAIPPAVKESLAHWKAREGRMARRVYSIPAGCLYGQTVRGTMIWLKSTWVQLNSAEEYLAGCPFWEDRLEELHHVEDREEFYRAYFPDGHPDEWTAAEKAKSHGDGVLRPGETVNMRRFTLLHFGKWARLAWDTVADLDGKQTPEEVMCATSVREVNLHPLRRKRVVQ